MRATLYSRSALVILALVGSAINNQLTVAQETSTAKEMSDSASVVMANRTIETRVTTKGFRIAIYDANGQVYSSKDLSGSIHLDVGKKSYDFPLTPTANASLGADADLSRAVGYDLRTRIKISGVDRGSFEYEATLRLSELLSDAFLMKLQGRCPISGKALQATENPPKLVFDGKPLFVCCNGCAAVVKQNPEKYLAQVYNASAQESRPGVFESTLADAEAIAQQERCPVLDERLDLVGVPLKMEVNGKIVFISCLGCAKYLRAEPDRYLTKLAQEGVTPPTWR